METIAVYWEPVIRVYGFDARKDVTMLAIETSQQKCDLLATSIDSINNDSCKYIMVLSQILPSGRIRFYLVMESSIANQCMEQFSSLLTDEKEATIAVPEPVDVLFFHGPHFQDRYGIVDSVFSSLEIDKIDLLATGCTGTSIYMVMKTGQAQLAKEMLSKNFTVPGSGS